MREPIENGYFNWLCAKVLEVDSQEYLSLMEILYDTEFTWVVPADKHRASDGIELRHEYERETFTKIDASLESKPCSIFEVFLSFAVRASFQTDIPEKNWFWEFITNLGLDRFRRVTESDVGIIEDILYTFTWRIYEPNGQGGMFPLSHTEHDQRELEIWFQFCEYVYDRGLL